MRHAWLRHRPEFYVRKQILFLICFLYSASLSARTLLDVPPSATPAPTPLPAAGTPTPVTAPVQPSINPGSAVGQNSQNGGAGANNSAGTALTAAGTSLMSHPPTIPAGIALMVMGLLAMKQGSHDANAAGQSANTYGSSYDQAGAAPSNPALNSGSVSFTTPPQVAQAIQNAGYTLGPNGVTAPDGSTTPYSAYSSPSAMSKAGLDPMAVAAAEKILAKIDQRYGSLKGGAQMLTGSDGGGGYSDSGGGAAPAGNMGGRDMWTLSNAARSRMIAGKTVKLDGEPIGVRGQNIFDMIHTAYDLKRNNQTFIDGAGGARPLMSRAPASASLQPH